MIKKDFCFLVQGQIVCQ